MTITDDKGFYLVNENDSLTAKCTIYKDGNEVSDYSGVTFKWEKLLGTGNVAMGTARTQVVTNSDVDNVLLLRCTATMEGESISETVTITDVSDPYEVYFEITGITGNCIRTGETALVAPKARRRSDGNNATVSSWTWSIRDNTGAAFTLTGKSGATFNAATASVSYEDIKRAGMGISGSVSATIKKTDMITGSFSLVGIQDAILVESCYKATQQNIAPSAPTSNNEDGSIPEGWSGTLISVSASMPYVWESQRTKDGNWSVWSTPILKNSWGKQGAKLRMRTWTENVVYLQGADGEEFYDVVVYNDKLYLCTKTHTSGHDNNPSASISGYLGYWESAQEWTFIATKLLLAEK